jgi:hypothetical protein
MRGRHERLVIEMFSLLSECFPHRQGPAFESAFLTLRAHMGAEQSIGVLNGMMSVMATMKAAGRLPELHPGRPTAGKDELFLLAMLSAAQRSERARPIEAAIAMLNTSYVYAVNVAVRSLAVRLTDAGVMLAPVSEAVFTHVAGYPPVMHDVVSATSDGRTSPKKPALRLLSA